MPGGVRTSDSERQAVSRRDSLTIEGVSRGRIGGACGAGFYGGCQG